MILFTDCQRRVATGYRAYLLLAACWLFVLCPFSGLPRHQLLKAQTTPAPSQQAPSEGWIPALSEEFPRWLSSEEATNVAEKLAQSQVSLNYENDSTCPLNITYATTGSVEIARDTGKTPLYFIGLTCRVANNTNREIKNIGFTLSRAGSAIKEVPVRLFRSIKPNGSREFSIPSSPENLRYLPIILKERPEALILRIDGVGFEDGGGWGKVPQIPTAPIGILQFDTGQLPQRIRVGKNLQEAHLLNQVAPVYPPVAKQARIQGMVVLEVTISREGDVSDARILSGHPLLIEAALEAVRQWKYKPTQLNGQPVEVVSSVEVQFTLDNNQGNSG